jgi:hypothetical protein
VHDAQEILAPVAMQGAVRVHAEHQYVGLAPADEINAGFLRDSPAHGETSDSNRSNVCKSVCIMPSILRM